jgi:hypothetical protein
MIILIKYVCWSYKGYHGRCALRYCLYMGTLFQGFSIQKACSRTQKREQTLLPDILPYGGCLFYLEAKGEEELKKYASFIRALPSAKTLK